MEGAGEPIVAARSEPIAAAVEVKTLEMNDTPGATNAAEEKKVQTPVEDRPREEGEVPPSAPPSAPPDVMQEASGDPKPAQAPMASPPPSPLKAPDRDLKGLKELSEWRRDETKGEGQPKKRKVGDLVAAPAIAAPLIVEESIRLTSSKLDAAPGVAVGDGGKRASSKKGWRTARTSFGVVTGTYACEVKVERLGKTGHARIGFGTYQCELQAPVGYDKFGFGYRDRDGRKLHDAMASCPEEYGEAFSEGDVVGMVIHLPKKVGEAEAEAGGDASGLEAPPTPAFGQVAPGSKIAFFKNGAFQGVAFEDFGQGYYHPCASLYTKPEEDPAASVVFNFGETELKFDYAGELRRKGFADLADDLKPIFDFKLKYDSALVKQRARK